MPQFSLIASLNPHYKLIRSHSLCESLRCVGLSANDLDIIRPRSTRTRQVCSLGKKTESRRLRRL